MVIKAVVVSFFERTSVRGVPRIVRHKTWGLRGLWLVGVLLLLGIAISQAVSIVFEFFEYPKVTLMREESIFKTFQSTGGMTFPSLTVCNLNPIANPALAEGKTGPEIPTAEEYSATIDAYLQSIPDQYEEAKNYLRSYRGYFEYIGAASARMLGHKKSNLLTLCDVVFQSASTDRHKVKCNYETIRNLTSPDFFNCYTVSVDLTNYTKTMGMPTGLSLVLYLDDGSQRLTDFYDLSNDNTQSAGARISVHTEGTLPDLWYSALDVSPGTATQILTRYRTQKRLDEPHGSCYDDNAEKVHLMDLDHRPLSYTALGCMNSCTMDKVVEQCHCVDPGLLVVGNNTYAHLPTCGNLKAKGQDDIEAVVQTLTCAMSYKKSALLQCAPGCLQECHEAKYTRTLSTAKWPKASQHLSFYEQVIRDKPYRYQFQDYETILQYVKLTNDTDKYDIGLENLTHLDLIEKRFIKISMHFEDLTGTLIEESPKVTPTSLFSQLGGVLNLYIGISLVLVVETIELFYHLAMALFKKSEDRPLGEARVNPINGEVK